MAIRLGPLVSSIRGKLGGPHGAYVYMHRTAHTIQARMTKTDAGKVAKGKNWQWAQMVYQHIDKWWQAMPDTHRACWTQQARWFTRESNSGWNYFVHVNMNRLMLGMPGLTAPPERPGSIKQIAIHSEHNTNIPPWKRIPVWVSGSLKDDAGGGEFDYDVGDIPHPPGCDPPFAPPDEDEEPPPPEDAPDECPPGLPEHYGIQAYTDDYFTPCIYCAPSAFPPWDGALDSTAPDTCHWASPQYTRSFFGCNLWMAWLWLDPDAFPPHWVYQMACLNRMGLNWPVLTAWKSTGLTPEGIYTVVWECISQPTATVIIEEYPPP